MASSQARVSDWKSELWNQYVDHLSSAGYLTDHRIAAAFRRVPRHEFVSGFFRLTEPGKLERIVVNEDDRDILAEIYSNTALVTAVSTRGDFLSSTSLPGLVAQMLALLDVRQGQNVLELGTGTGYNAALLAELVGDAGKVVTVEIDPDIGDRAQGVLAAMGYENVEVVTGDAALGVGGEGGFDRIVATFRCSDVAPAWLAELSRDGSMLIPLEHGGASPLTRLAASGRHSAEGRIVGWSSFMPNRGSLLTQQTHVRDTRIWHLEPICSEPLWPGLDEAGMRRALWFFSSLNDRGTTVMAGEDHFAISDGPTGWAAVEADRVRYVDHTPPIQRLRELYNQWLVRGRPALDDYYLSFVPIDEADLGTVVNGDWVLRRTFFAEIVHLSRS